MNNFFILIPPSEGKASDGSGPAFKKVTKDISVMVERLKQVKGGDGKLLGVKGKALEAAVSANRNILISPTMPAIERYTGVVYQGLDYHSLKPKAKKYADERVRIVSAVFGLVAPSDLIPDYKLKIEKLDAHKHWSAVLSKTLEKSFVIDLLPQAHRKAVSYQDGIAVEFVIMKNKKAVAAGHQGKYIKGRFIRWLAENGINDPKQFSQFKEDGFRWDGQRFTHDTGS